MSFHYDLHKRLYKNVAASSSESLDYIPIDGDTIVIDVLGANSSAAPDTNACIVWDPDGTPEILLSSYGDVVQTNLAIERLGDGVKKIRIHLVNDLTEPAYIGGFWQAEVLK